MLEWKLGIEQHRNDQLRRRLRQCEAEAAKVEREFLDPGIVPGECALFGVARRQGEFDSGWDSRQLLQDLRVLGQYQRKLLNRLACIPERREPAMQLE